ncbi:MAG: hypothetical protein JWO19_490, partial [Bryobacterales bacterium]|nr:hypothetical protein [Bryobacterales bacterium]
EALAGLKQRGKKVGYPYETHDRVRTVRVDGFPCSDEVVFAVASDYPTALRMRSTRFLRWRP